MYCIYSTKKSCVKYSSKKFCAFRAALKLCVFYDEMKVNCSSTLAMISEPDLNVTSAFFIIAHIMCKFLAIIIPGNSKKNWSLFFVRISVVALTKIAILL